MKINVSGEEYICRFKVAGWQNGGPDYKVVDKVKGIHFNDMPPSEMKKQIAKVYLEQELKNIFSGGKFDHDRHGAQMKIDIDENNGIVTLGIFDNGAMAVEEPNDNSKERLGKVLDRTVHNVMVGFARNILLHKGVNVAAAFTEAVTKNINDTDKKNANEQRTEAEILEDFKSRDYVLCVQRGLLALNDFMREIDSIDCLKLFIQTFKRADEQIINPLSSFKKTHLLEHSDELMAKIDAMQAKRLDKAEVGRSLDDVLVVAKPAHGGKSVQKEESFDKTDNEKIDDLISLYIDYFVKQSSIPFDPYAMLYNNKKFGKLSGVVARTKRICENASKRSARCISETHWKIFDKVMIKQYD